jgi:hypothetical protein
MVKREVCSKMNEIDNRVENTKKAISEFEMEDKTNRKETPHIIHFLKELNDFFNSSLKLEEIGIFFVPSRKALNLLVGKETEAWMVAFTNNNNRILMLDRQNFEKESCHKYHEQYYNDILKHELTHVFTFSLYKLIFPDWLIEGIAIYLSGQIKSYKVPIKFEKFLTFWEGSGEGLCEESGFVVEKLIQKHGKNKLLRLCELLKGNQSQEYFNNKFKEIYGSQPTYEFFNNLLN